MTERDSVDSTMEKSDIIFVTGASRSGTTMLSRILGNHSMVLGLKELHFFGDVSDPDNAGERIDEKEQVRLAAALLARQARGIWGSGCTVAERARAKTICAGLESSEQSPFDIFAAVVSLLARESGKSIACEQTPRNIFYAGSILDALPRARVIHIVRDPRAVLASQKNRWRLRKLGAKNVPVSELIRTWLNYHPITMSKLWVNATRAALRLVGHPRMKIVRFEDLVEDPDQVITDVCEFLGIGFEANMHLVPQWGSSNVAHQTHEMGIASAVAGRWARILGAGEIRIVQWLAAPLMSRFDYQERRMETTFAQTGAGWYLSSYPFHLIGVVLANPRRAWIQLSAVLGSNRNE